MESFAHQGADLAEAAIIAAIQAPAIEELEQASGDHVYSYPCWNRHMFMQHACHYLYPCCYHLLPPSKQPKS